MLLILAGVFVVAQLTCWGIAFVNPPQKTYRWVVPETMHGEFVLRCLVPGAPPLPVESGFRLVRFGNGVRVVDTADEYVFGNEYFREEFYADGPEGLRRVKGVDCSVTRSEQHVRVDVRCTIP
jgi:hypothetical protein